jgi:hypothetical protein
MFCRCAKHVVQAIKKDRRLSDVRAFCLNMLPSLGENEENTRNSMETLRGHGHWRIVSPRQLRSVTGRFAAEIFREDASKARKIHVGSLRSPGRSKNRNAEKI